MGRTRVDVEVLNPAECMRLLRSVAYGKIFASRAMPAIQPVNFVVDGDSLVIRTSSESRLAVAAAGSVLAFEVDGIDPVTRGGWSVTVVGRSSIIEDPAEVERFKALRLESWAVPGSERLISIAIEQLTGRWPHSPVVDFGSR